jgi:hypothetical protein
MPDLLPDLPIGVSEDVSFSTPPFSWTVVVTEVGSEEWEAGEFEDVTVFGQAGECHYVRRQGPLA